MSATLQFEIDPVLLERVNRFATSNGWELEHALRHLVESGLFACEAEAAANFSDSDADALRAAIAALEQIDDDPGFSLIGRAPGANDATRAPAFGQAG